MFLVHKKLPRNTNVFNMEKLLESLGARLERMEQTVPNLKPMADFPSIEEARDKQKNSLRIGNNRRTLKKNKRANKVNNSQIVFYANNCN